MVWVAVILSALAAGVIQSVTGFGAAVVMMLVVPHFLGMATAPALVSSICIFLAIALAWKFRKKIMFRQTLTVAVLYIIVSSVTIWVSASWDLDFLSLIFGLFLIVLSFYYLVLAKNLTISPTPVSTVVCSMLSGLFGGLFSTGGPIASILFMGMTRDKISYIANIQFLFVMTNMSNTLVRIFRGVYTADLIPLTIVGFLGINLGKQIGLKVLDRIDIDLMRRLVYAFIGVSGVINVYKYFF